MLEAKCAELEASKNTVKEEVIIENNILKYNIFLKLGIILINFIYGEF